METSAKSRELNVRLERRADRQNLGSKTEKGSPLYLGPRLRQTTAYSTLVASVIGTAQIESTRAIRTSMPPPSVPAGPPLAARKASAFIINGTKAHPSKTAATGQRPNTRRPTVAINPSVNSIKTTTGNARLPTPLRLIIVLGCENTDHKASSTEAFSHRGADSAVYLLPATFDRILKSATIASAGPVRTTAMRSTDR